jgi:superfamily II DNA/RNA helicase
MADDPLMTTAASFTDLGVCPGSASTLSRHGITVPAPIQGQAIPHLLRKRDLVGQARTGSGKTLAFTLPLVELCDPSLRGVQALVVVPTRELAAQVVGESGELFTHRVGRTGRAGQAITFVMPEDSHTLRQIERRLGRPLPRR